jgi:hypothetical protein
MNIVSDIGIIGGGFSAYCLANKYPSAEIITCRKSIPHAGLKRNNLNINSAFGKQALSFGSINFDIPKGMLHDRLLIGGNSEIWGGFIDLTKNTRDISDIINKYLLDINLLEFKPGDSIFSRNGKLHILLNHNNKVFSASDYFKNHTYINGYVTSVALASSYVAVHFIDENGAAKVVNHKELFIASGVVQILDLLVNSGFIKNNDIISLTDKKYILKSFSDRLPRPETYGIDFKFLPALFKVIDSKLHNNLLFDFGPYCVSQLFTNINIELELKAVIHEHNVNFVPVKMQNNFGKSIHYGAVKINGITLSDFISNVSEKKIKIIGTASINDLAAGPVSNQIISQVYEL